MKNISPLFFWFFIILMITISGVVGFMLIEGYRFLDAVFMTIITITTIGYGEVHPLSDAGRIFAIFLILISFSTITYSLARLTQFIVSGEMKEYFINKKIMNTLDSLSNHVIICGFGRNGQQAAKTLIGHKIDFVVVDRDSNNINQFKHNEHKSLLYINGDATEDVVLKDAGIDRAASLICALPTDADNVFIVLSARALNSKLQIISRASNATSIPKLKKAGASNVIMPDRIGGTHMATLVSKPEVVEFIDFLSGEEAESINIESIDFNVLPKEIQPTTLSNIMQWKTTGVNCIAIKDANGKFIINPPIDFLVQEGMKMIVLGTKFQIAAMKQNVG